MRSPGRDEPFSVARSDALHARAFAFIEAFSRGDAEPESFDLLACDLARHQHTAGYGRLAAAVGSSLRDLTRASEVPAIPTDAFKVTRVAAHPPTLDGLVFRTSGTTVGSRGAHYLRHARTCNRGAIALAARVLCPTLGEHFPVLVLGPSPSELPDSSLAHMLGTFVGAFDRTRRTGISDRFFLRNGVLELDALDEAVARLSVQNAPIFLAGTSFAFVHLLDAVGEHTLRLPTGSLVMQTGGFKGRSREVSAAELRNELARTFDLPTRAIVAEYGMTELSSQGWEMALTSDAGEPGDFMLPPWMRIEAADPETLEVLPAGAQGLARITDLLNVDSAVVVQTADLVTVRPTHVTLHGRAPGATPRGCSLAIDELLGP